MNFSGIIEMDEIPAIQELLKDAKSFCCYGFDCYERYWDITDEEYLAQLETKREEITHEILERCRTKRKNLYITGPVALNVAQSSLYTGSVIKKASIILPTASWAN